MRAWISKFVFLRYNIVCSICTEKNKLFMKILKRKGKKDEIFKTTFL